MDDAQRLEELRNKLKLARANYAGLSAAAPPRRPSDEELADLLKQVHDLEADVADLASALPALQAAQAEGVQIRKDAERRRGIRINRGLVGCGVPAALALLVAAAAVFFAMDFFGDDDDAPECPGSTTSLGDVRVQLVADCDAETTPTPTASTTSPTSPVSGVPDPDGLPAGQVLYVGTSGGQLGCIACDGQSRFINIEDSTTALGDDTRAGQEIRWPTNGSVVDFGVKIPRPTKGRYGINLFVNGAYSVGCAIETGSSSCRVPTGQEPSPLAAGDRVTIIVGEAGIVDDDGVPVEEGDFILEWWFVFQPA